MEKVKMAIIGMGNIGKKYARMLYNGEVSNIELAMVCSGSEKNQEWAADNFGERFKVCKTPEELFLNSPDFDAVLIATPHTEHARLTYLALESGLSVLCEKPAGITATQAMEMNSNAFRCAKPFAMMFQKRAMPVYAKMHEILSQRGIGSINRIYMESSEYFRTKHYHNSSAWRSTWEGEGGGALINQGQHYLDLWQWLFGMPNSLKASIKFGKYSDIAVDDEAVINMKYGNGADGIFVITTGEQVGSSRIVASGTKGKLVAEGNTLKYWKYKNSTDDLVANSDKDTVSESDYEYFEYNFDDVKVDPYAVILENFASNILDGTPLIAKGIDGVNSISITNAAYLSAWIDSEISFPMDNNYYNAMLNEKIEEEKRKNN